MAGWRIDPFKIVIFQTGVGTRALFQATDAAGLTGELLQHLSSSAVVVRGPKPVGELNARDVRIDIRAATPFTTEMVLAAVSAIPMQDARVLVQRYGAANQLLREALEERGASVQEIATYRWALPADIQPLTRALDALARSGIDAVVFTSAVQIHNLYAVAEKSGRSSDLASQLNRLSSPRSVRCARVRCGNMGSRRHSKPIRRNWDRWSPDSMRLCRCIADSDSGGRLTLRAARFSERLRGDRV